MTSKSTLKRVATQKGEDVCFAHFVPRVQCCNCGEKVCTECHDVEWDCKGATCTECGETFHFEDGHVCFPV